MVWEKEKDADYRRQQEEIRKESERVERLQREVNERLAMEAKTKRGGGG